MKHNGVIFAVYEYQRIPFYYKNQILDIGSSGEELAFLFFRIYKKHKNDKVFVYNFLQTWSKVIGKQLNDMTYCDFSHFKKYVFKRSFPKTVSNVVTCGGVYTYNPCIEPATIFIGRGAHPLRGSVKRPLTKSDVTLNITSSYKSMVGTGWENIVYIDALWIARFKDTLSCEYRYVMMNGAEKVNNIKKFDIARVLAKGLRVLRVKNSFHMNSPQLRVMECATCISIIDSLCLRVGNEKDPVDTVNTVGCCSLLVKHVKLSRPGNVRLVFRGKDDVSWDKTVVNEQLLKNLSKLCIRKTKDDNVFNVNPNIVNQYLNSLKTGITAKCFRTCHASMLMCKLLSKSSTINEFKEANRNVANLLCHQSNGKPHLETSKVNYIDPRIIISWCKKNNISKTNVYTSQMIEKHKWACSVSENFVYI